MRNIRITLLVFIASIVIYGFGFVVYKMSLFSRIHQLISGKKTVETVLSQYEKKVDSVFIPIFEQNNIPYPPENLTLVGFKKEQVLEVWTAFDGKMQLLKKYPFTTTSGKQGPKLIRGDGQIPEGFYKIESLNPNSAFHLSLKLDYPNEFDRQKANLDGRLDPGDNIFIHGRSQSIGCIAIGDDAIEELFVLAAKTPIKKLDVILFPYDMRNHGSFEDCPHCPDWVSELYNLLKSTSTEFQSSLLKKSK